jgi:hypothetical protein
MSIEMFWLTWCLLIGVFQAVTGGLFVLFVLSHGVAFFFFFFSQKVSLDPLSSSPVSIYRAVRRADGRLGVANFSIYSLTPQFPSHQTTFSECSTCF